MSTRLQVKRLEFTFPAGWEATKYDDWQFYRTQFARIANGVKAVDILAMDPATTVFLIEVKDYRMHPRTKPIDIADEVRAKVLHTLAALLPARLNAADADEQRQAGRALRRQVATIRVVLHLEQPATHSKLFPRAIDRADVWQRLRRCVKPIDPHPVVVESAEMGSLSWTVRST